MRNWRKWFREEYFLRCLNLLEEPTSERLIIDGIPLVEQRKDINRLRQR